MNAGKKTNKDAQVDTEVATRGKLRLEIKRMRLQTTVKAGMPMDEPTRTMHQCASADSWIVG